MDELVKPDWMSDEQWTGLMHYVRSVDGIKQDAKLHVEAYLATDGVQGYMREGAPLPCLLLTTIGRKSGNKVTPPLNYIPHGDGYLVVGSLAGNENDPSWALNLKENPQAWLQLRDKKWDASVRQLTEAERAALWPGMLRVMPLWGIFQQRTDRQFPVFLITPNHARRLSDVDDISRIKGLYCDLIDRIMRERKQADVDRLLSLFTEDAVLDFSSLGQGTPKGHAAIAEHFTKTLPSAVCWMYHSVHSQAIDVNGDEAIGRWTLYAMAVPIDNPKGQPFAIYGRYIDTFKRVGGIWYQSGLKFHNETRMG